MTQETISIIIPVYNGGESFKSCLASIRDSLCTPDEVIVVSDGDTDGSWQVSKSFGFKVFRLPTSGGPARARNIGAREAQGNILFFMDADVALHSNTLSLIKARFLEQPGLAALIGSYDDSPGANNFLSQYKNLFHHYTHQVSSEEACTFWGACGAIRKSVFNAAGGFDESYLKPCIEDIELGYRLKRSGYAIRLFKDIQVKHLKCWEPLSLLRAEIFYRALPWADLILRSRHFNADLNLSYTNRLSVIFVFALVGSMITSSLLPWALAVAAILALGLLFINAGVYRFFYRKRGLLFTLKVIPWHWFYFLYGGIAFGYVLVAHYLWGQKLPKF